MSEPWRNDKWFTSPWNFLPEVRAELQFPGKVKLHDVTLRDGEQQAGIIFTMDEKIRIADALAEAGVHRIEAGMPAVSPEDEAAIKTIVKRNYPNTEVFAFARCMKDDVKRAVDCGVDGVVIEIPSSTHMIEKAYGWKLEKAIELSIEATRYAHEQGLYTVFFPIDLSRADFDWGLSLLERVATEGWMDALAIVDTMGGLAPHAVPWLVKKVKERIKGKPIECHFHDDFGMGAANTLLALAAGAEVAHTTVSALGERAGNAPYEDLTLALLTLYGVDMGIKTERLVPIARMLEEITGQPNRWNRGITGKLISSIESGIISGWYRNCKDDPTMLTPFNPSLVGGAPLNVVLGKNNGADSIKVWLEKIGETATDEQVTALVNAVKSRAYEKHGLLDEADFRVLVKKVKSA
ncbi:MAG: LeuA family protein [Symbiobacteriia bacterium]